MYQGESLQERARPMWRQCLPSPPLPSPSEGIGGETQAGAGAGPRPPRLQMAAFLLCAHVAFAWCVHAEDKRALWCLLKGR